MADIMRKNFSSTVAALLLLFSLAPPAPAQTQGVEQRVESILKHLTL